MIDPDLSAVGLRTFFRIATRWSLSDQQQAVLLGLASTQHLEALKRSHLISRAGLERISHILSIYRAINTLLPNPQRADRWMNAANTAAVFAGKTPVERMSSGHLEDLLAVRRYLDAQVQR